MIIKEFLQKSKRKIEEFNQSDLYTVIVIILIGFVSFGLGRLSFIQDNREQIHIEFPEYLSATVLNSKNTDINTSVSVSQGLLIASKNGSKYHYPWCSGGKRIAEKNKIWFDSIEEAQKAGYTPASNCKGLK